MIQRNNLHASTTKSLKKLLRYYCCKEYIMDMVTLIIVTQALLNNAKMYRLLYSNNFISHILPHLMMKG